MNIEFLILGGYGKFVWPAFIFTFFSFSFLYLKTKKELRRQEKIFLKEFKQLQAMEIQISKSKENTKESLSASSI